jgi:hypothetical protein
MSTPGVAMGVGVWTAEIAEAANQQMRAVLSELTRPSKPKLRLQDYTKP